MAGDNLLTQSRAPLGFLESNKNKAISNEQRTFYKHTVTCKEFQHFILTH